MNSASLQPELATIPSKNRVVTRSSVRSRETTQLRAGEWVEVLSPDEILATLDDDGCLEGMPFMPEMVQYCGRRFRVFKSAHKTCDTIDRYVIRRMADAVHLDGLRCDGAEHGGCQAACLLFWKTAWLKRVDSPSAGTSERQTGHVHDLEFLRGTTRAPSADGTKERYRCQATQVLEATTEVRRRDRWDPRFYLKDLTSGNVGLFDFVRYGLLAACNAFSLRWFGSRYPHLCGTARGKTPACDLSLQPGQAVEVRSKDEIMKTLNANLRNRGLYFDVEMVPFCEAGTFKVLKRVEKIIDEKSGEMITLPNPCLILDGVTCSGNISSNRMFCPRSVYPYWREAWLKPVEPQGN